MYKNDIEDDENFDFSILDRAKIEDLELNDKMESESGAFSVSKLKNGYHIWCGRGKNKGVFNYPTLDTVFEFLESN